MSFILIDRRKAARGKSASSRQKLIRRIKSFIKSSSPQNIGQGGVAGQHAKGTSPVAVAGNALEEPWFAYSNEGEHVAVVIGNTEYERGDEIEVPEGGGQGGSGSGSGGGSGEDDFIVNIARDEFLDLFYEDCELPNLTNEKFTEKLDNKFQQAGFSTEGSPAQLSIVRTYKQALGRQAAMGDDVQEEKERLQKELDVIFAYIYDSGRVPNDGEVERIKWIETRLIELDVEIDFIEGFDTSDLRYRRREAKPLKTVDAVLFMMMDISGSMDENKKIISRRWFALFYAFIKRRYPNTELVFIAHTEEPFEMSESDFFSTRMNGGTAVSPALKLINNIILERYDPNETNIYISHASDGDNYGEDNQKVVSELLSTGRLINKIQLFSYVEVGKNSTGWYNLANVASGKSTREDSGLWTAYDIVRQKVTEKKVTLAIIESPDECYPIFKKVFKKSK